MKSLRLFFALVLCLGMAACDQKPKSATEQVRDKVNDALDRRPNEKLRDAAEDLHDGAKDVAKELKDAKNEVAKDLKAAKDEVVKEVKEAEKKAGH
ncbi:MAG: hypothetical protein IPJ17_05230 [Holophagales bacterium]|nr:MAG: hypothetical protein IPJ17_05230 [Holophagales bacterium]